MNPVAELLAELAKAGKVLEWEIFISQCVLETEFKDVNLQLCACQNFHGLSVSFLSGTNQICWQLQGRLCLVLRIKRNSWPHMTLEKGHLAQSDSHALKKNVKL